MDEMFITCILDIVDPKRELSPQAVIKLVEEKFTSTNTGSPKLPPCNWCDGWSERSQFGHYLYCPECGRQLRAGA